jgi:hypothetical protein
MTEKLLMGLLGTLVAGLAFGGWHLNGYIATNLASKNEVRAVTAKADILMDQRIEALVGQIAFLERKSNKTLEELNQLEYLRKQLEIMRDVQRGK